MTISPSKLFSTGLLSLAFLFSNSAFAASFDVTPAPVNGTYMVGQTITFTATTAADNHNWDFGDATNNPYISASGTQRNVRYGSAVKPGTGNPPQREVDSLTTVTYIYGSAGDYTVTLASQIPFPSNVLQSLATTVTIAIKVIDNPNGNISPIDNRPMAVIYDENCSRCHGIVIKPGALNAGTVNKGENSMLAGRKVTPVLDPTRLAPTNGVQITGTLITGAYALNPTYMPKAGPNGAGVYFLEGLKADKMASYINTLVVNVDTNGNSKQTGEELYRTTCSRCHGTGDGGGYASDLFNNQAMTLTRINNAILDFADMKTLDLTNIDVQSIVDFINAKIPLPRPTTGADLNEMYCSYCHGLDGKGGAYAKFSIFGQGVTASSIKHEIDEYDDDNMMGNLQRARFTMDELQLIANELK